MPAEKVSYEQKGVELRVKDLKRWSQLAWSYLGMGADGWKKEDEENWDRAVGMYEDLVKRSSWWKSEGDGGTFDMIADVIIVSK